MSKVDPQRVIQLRVLITDFLKKRLEGKLEKIHEDEPMRAELHRQFIPATWLEDAARRVKQIQAVTHSLKPIHPDAKGSSLYSPPHVLPVLQVVGSHCLEDDFLSDAVGNAAALDVYKFLKLEHRGRTFLTLVLAGDADLAAALTDDPVRAKEWTNAFAGLIKPRGRVASHTFAKQLYWPIGDVPHDDGGFHLLAPLYASSLVHRVYRIVQDDRFSEEAAAARNAKKEGQYSERPVREYSWLAIQKLGGTKPQNISQLNCERRGDNLLFASLPPAWRSVDPKPLLATDSMFHRYGQRAEVKKMLRSFLSCLKTDSAHNHEAQKRCAQWIDGFIDEFLQFSAELRVLQPGWSQSPECCLANAEKHWLDPEGVEQALALDGLPLPSDTSERVSQSFANWLNAQLRDPLPMEDPAYLEWRNQMHEQLRAEEMEGRYEG